MFCGSHCPPQNSEQGLHEKLSGPCQDCLLSLESGSRTPPQRQAKGQILPWVRGSRRGRAGAVKWAMAGATVADSLHAAFSATATVTGEKINFAGKNVSPNMPALHPLKSTLQPARQNIRPLLASRTCHQRCHLPPHSQSWRKRTWRTAEHTARATPINTRWQSQPAFQRNSVMLWPCEINLMRASGQDISALHLRCQLHTQASNHNGIFTIFCSYSADPKLSHCSPSLSQAACARFKFHMNKASPYTSRICFQRNKVPDLVSEGHRHSVTIFLGNCFDVPGKWRPRRPST